MTGNHTDSQDVRGASELASSRRILVALSLLHEAEVRAREGEVDRWQFAVEIDEFRAAGLQHADLRWLVLEGLAEHGEEKTRPKDKRRVFRRLDNLAFGTKTCFVLTEKGAGLARLSPAVPSCDGQAVENPGPHPTAALRPRWDAARRELALNGYLIKHFRQPATNQETILAAFEEDGWPARIDDPLSRTHQVDPRTRLHEAIRSLNQCQNLPLLRFSGDGTGQGVMWGFNTHGAPIGHPQRAPR